jgi:hypothetical protein
MTLDALLSVGTLWIDDVFEGRGRLMAAEDGYVVWGHPHGGLNVVVPVQQFLKEFSRAR